MLRTLTEYDVCGLSQQSCLVLSDEAGEEEVDEEEEEDEEEEKEAMEKEPHVTQMRLALADISDPAELCALPGMRGPRQLATFAVAKYFRPGCPFLYGGSPWQA